MDKINNNPKTAGRKVDFKHINYGYRRLVPIYGPEYILDVVLSYRRGQGKSINVRKHAYAVQTFARSFFKELEPLNTEEIKSTLKPIRSIVQKIKFMLGPENYNDARYEVCDKNDAEGKLFEAKTSSKMFYPYLRRIKLETVNIIVPLSGRLKTFKTFMRHLEVTSLSKGDKVNLLVVLFDQFPGENSEANKTIDIIHEYKIKYPNHYLEIIKIEAEFSRGAGLELGASHFGEDSLLFFCDVDVFFTAHFLEKCRKNTEIGKRIFYPILFSEFSPSFSRVKSKWQRAGKFTMKDFSRSLSQSLVDDIKPRGDHFRFSERAGFWRSYGYGLLCVYQKDFINSGGFDSSIRGWGLEDVDLVDKFLGEKGERINFGDNTDRIEVIRAPDPTLVHVYHPSNCDSGLPENQLEMCLASRASSIAHSYDLRDVWLLSSYHRKKRRDNEIKKEVENR